MIVLRQGDPAWSKHKLGTSTIGRIGCLATVYAQASRHLRIDENVTPVDVVERGVFHGNGLIQPDTGKRLGIVVSDVTHENAVHRNMRGELLSALLTGVVVVMWVDHDSEKPEGDPEGDHFVLGIGVDGDAVVFADPATGTLERMPIATLECDVGKKRYKLRSVRPLRKA